MSLECMKTLGLHLVIHGVDAIPEDGNSTTDSGGRGVRVLKNTEDGKGGVVSVIGSDSGGGTEVFDEAAILVDGTHVVGRSPGALVSESTGTSDVFTLVVALAEHVSGIDVYLVVLTNGAIRSVAVVVLEVDTKHDNSLWDVVIVNNTQIPTIRIVCT